MPEEPEHLNLVFEHDVPAKRLTHADCGLPQRGCVVQFLDSSGELIHERDP